MIIFLQIKNAKSVYVYKTCLWIDSCTSLQRAHLCTPSPKCAHSEHQNAPASRSATSCLQHILACDRRRFIVNYRRLGSYMLKVFIAKFLPRYNSVHIRTCLVLSRYAIGTYVERLRHHRIYRSTG